jgi:outer membrane protein assembly factor BamB
MGSMSTRHARTMTLHIAALLLVCLVPSMLRAAPRPASAPAQSSPADWTQYRHDAQRSGRAGADLPSGSKLHLQWAYSFGERVEVEVEPIVAAGRAYVGSMNGIMAALNIADGSQAWTFQAGPIAHTAAYAGGRLFFGSLDGFVYALDASTGAEQWRFQTGGPVYAAPALDGATVYIGSTAGRFFALDAATGLERWRYPAGSTPAGPFSGAAALSPDGSRLYVGNEDLVARALATDTGSLIWQQKLTGVGMRATHPVVANSGQVVFFQTTKPGTQSYVPTEDYPNASLDSDPTEVWNSYFQQHPERRSTFFLRASDGAELWDPAARRYVPLPIPYWGMLAPVLDGDGNAWFPTSGGGQGQNIGAHSLDHDSRLMRIALDSGSITQAAVREAFRMRHDENGRATMAGTQYVTTISEDMGAYQTAGGGKTTLFGSPVHGFGSHMDPIGPLPSKQLWRYGGAVTMGGVPGASPPVIAGGLVYYISYGWLFALGSTDRGLDPTGTAPINFQSRDGRLSQLTYPRTSAPTPAELRDELNQRFVDLMAAGTVPPMARFDQPGVLMTDDISGYQLFGTTGEQIWILSQALRFVAPDRQDQARAYLRSLAENELFNPERYGYGQECLVYGESGVQRGDACTAGGKITAAWQVENDLLVGERLYAMAAYSEATGDWSLVNARWSFIKGLFDRFPNSYDIALGVSTFPKWHSGKLGLASQIGGAAGMVRMATHQGDGAAALEANLLLDSLLATRTQLAHTMETLYATGQVSSATIRIDADGTLNREDIFVYNDPGELIPIDGERSAATDVRQVNWLESNQISYHSSSGFMHYPALVGYSPLYPELATQLRSALLAETRQYVQTYEVNMPWWWMGDLAHHTTSGGEHLWESPTLSHDLFQTKALVLQEDWEVLVRQLPLPISANPRYDFYRLHNLATLLALSSPDLSRSSLTVNSPAPANGDTVLVSFYIQNAGGPLSTPVDLTLTLPPQLIPVDGSASAATGAVSVSGQTLQWSGSPGAEAITQVSLRAVVSEPTIKQVAVAAQLVNSEAGAESYSYQIILNGYSVALPQIDTD